MNFFSREWFDSKDKELYIGVIKKEIKNKVIEDGSNGSIVDLEK